MDLRKSFSKPFKKLKDKLLGGSRKRNGRSESEDSRKGRETGVTGGEASQRISFMHSEVSVDGVAESGPSREETDVEGKTAALVDVDPPTSAPSISRIGGPDGMWTTSFKSTFGRPWTDGRRYSTVS